ncbi:hypothetical protein ACLKA6_002867 [Drosophila palustris]
MLCDRCGAGSILVPSWVTCLRGSTLTTVNTHPTRTQNETKQINFTIVTATTKLWCRRYFLVLLPTATREISDATRNIEAY